MRREPNRVRWRLTLWYTFSLSLIFVVFSANLYFIVRSASLAPIHAQIDREYVLLEQTTFKALDGIPALETGGVVSAFSVMENGRSTYSPRGWIGGKLPDKTPAGSKGVWRVESENGRHYFLRESTVSHGDRTFQIGVAQDIEQVYGSLQQLALALLLGFPVVVLVSLVGGYFFAGRVLAPIRAMANKAQEITADKLSERLHIHDADDEFGHLARVFNETFGRLEDSFDRMRRFTADASHELRTPLTVIRSVGENALQHSHDPARHADSIGSMLEETDRLVRLLDDLLLLTRAESGKLPLQVEEFDVAELALDVVNCLRVLAEEKQQELNFVVQDAPRARGDQATIRQALINLLANAIRYTPEHGRITVKALRTIQGDSIIEVADNGPGIAPEHQLRIFDRFYRIDAGRSRDTGGAGLGLAIARWAIEINGGTIALESTEAGGSIFRICLPAKRQ
ncbi:ATP-binding protein [soil metagenome]